MTKITREQLEAKALDHAFYTVEKCRKELMLIMEQLDDALDELDFLRTPKD